MELSRFAHTSFCSNLIALFGLFTSLRRYKVEYIIKSYNFVSYSIVINASIFYFSFHIPFLFQTLSNLHPSWMSANLISSSHNSNNFTSSFSIFMAVLGQLPSEDSIGTFSSIGTQFQSLRGVADLHSLIQ